MKKFGRTDANQTKVVNHLRKAGFSVAITSSIGNGFPDLVVAGHIKRTIATGTSKDVRYRLSEYSSDTKTVLVELKDPDKPLSQQKLTLKELVFMELWKGEYIKATTAEEIIKLFNQ